MPDDFANLLILAVSHHNNGMVIMLRFYNKETFMTVNVS